MTERAPIQLVEAPVEALPDLDDDDLMLLAKTGREDAFETLVRRHQQLVLGLATRFFADKTQGRDVAQDVFLSLWAERDRYRARGRFRGYLVTVTTHRCHMVARSQKSQQSRAAKDGERKIEPEQELPLGALVERERAREVRELLCAVPEKQRQVLILRFTHDMALEEIATDTDMPLGTVKSHLFRGLKRLRKLVQEES